MRSLVLLAMVGVLVFVVGCGPAEKEGMANAPATPPAADTKTPETSTPKPATETPKPATEAPKDDKSGAQIDQKPVKPVPGPGAAPTLDK